MAGKLFAEDFSREKNNGDFNCYIAKKEYKVFGKAIKDKPLELDVHEKQSIGNCISKVNEYMNWLCSDCKDELVSCLCEHINSYSSVTAEELYANNWYESLEIHRVLLTITETGKIGADISCSDNYDEGHILDMELLEKNIEIVGYDG